MWWWRWRKRSIQDLILGCFKDLLQAKVESKTFQKYPGEVCRKNFLQEKKEFVETSAEVFVEFRTEKLNDRMVHIGNNFYLHYVLSHFLKFCFDLIWFKSKQLSLKKWNMFKTPHQQLKVLDYVPKTNYTASPPDFVNMTIEGGVSSF